MSRRDLDFDENTFNQHEQSTQTQTFTKGNSLLSTEKDHKKRESLRKSNQLVLNALKDGSISLHIPNQSISNFNMSTDR